MEIREMNLEELQARAAEIAAEQAEANEERCLELLKELEELEARKVELNDLEVRKAQAEALQTGEAKPEKIIERKKEIMSDMIYAVDSVEYRNAYTKKLFGRAIDEVEQRSLTSAAAVIPTQTVNEVIGKMKEAPILDAVAISQFPNYVRFPVVAASAAASAAAVGSAITEGTNTLSYVDLTPNEYTKLISLQSDIQNMAIDALHAWLVDNIVTEIRAKIAADVLTGSGTNCCKGITASVAAAATNLAATVTKANLLAVMAALDSRYHSGAIWVMTPAVFYTEVMAATALNDYVINDGFQQKLFGHPVILMDEARVGGKETIFFGDPKQYKLNLFTALEIKPFETATSLNVQYRGGCLADGELVDTNAFVRFAKA